MRVQMTAKLYELRSYGLRLPECVYQAVKRLFRKIIGAALYDTVSDVRLLLEGYKGEILL